MSLAFPQWRAVTGALVLALCLLMLSGAASRAQADCGPGSFVPHQVIVKLNPLPEATVEQINATYGSTTLEIFPGSTNVYLLNLPTGSGVTEMVERMASDPRLLYAEPASEMVARFVGRGMVVPALVIGRTSERVVVDLWGTRLPVRGAGQSGERRSLCLRSENLAITPSGGIRGRVTGLAFHGAATLLTVQPDSPDAPELKVDHSGPPPEAGSAVTVEVRDGWIIPQAGS